MVSSCLIAEQGKAVCDEGHCYDCCTCFECDDDFYEDDCQRCDEYGLVLVCVDDMCQGLGECIHGEDGYAVCNHDILSG